MPSQFSMERAVRCRSWVCPHCGVDAREDFLAGGPDAVALPRIGGDSANGYEAYHVDCFDLWIADLDPETGIPRHPGQIRRHKGRAMICDDPAAYDRLLRAVFG